MKPSKASGALIKRGVYMKTLIQKTMALAFIATSLSLLSCNKQSDSSSSSGRPSCDTRVQNCAGNNVNASQIYYQMNGRFLGSDQQSFQNNAAILVDATIPMSWLGSVDNGTLNNNTGIAFGGRVMLSSGRFNGLSTNGTVINSSSVLIQVYDSYVGTIDSTTGKANGPVGILFSPDTNSTATGTVNPSNTNITFTDKFGSITFSGTFDTAYFQGTVSFTNNVRVDQAGVSGGSGNFSFRVPVCSFFVCQ